MHSVQLSCFRVFVLSAAAAAVFSAHGAVVLSNSAAGDAYSNASGVNQGQAVGASGWVYNNVRNGGTVGISGALPQSGNGSVAFTSPNNGKADIEYLASGFNVGGNFFATSTLGAFSSLSAMQYDWYRSAGSTATNWLHPSMRVLLDLDGNLATTGDRGGLVFESVYNTGNAAVATDTWVTSVIGAQTLLWNFGLGLGNEFDIDGDGTPYDSLAEWQASGRLANAVILGFSSGVGSGWAPFAGAVDNIGWTLNGQSVSTNFEIAGGTVPEPATLALVGLALLGAATTRRKKVSR